MQSPVNANDDAFKIYYLSEKAVTLEFGHEISEALLTQISRVNALINRKPFAGFCTTVPAYGTLSVFFDPLTVIQSPMPGENCFDKVSAYLHQLTDEPGDQLNTPGNIITIPVCYGSQHGEDLDEVAALHNLNTEEVIKLHTSVVYKVYMIGFVPGFAYLGGMCNQLATPRKRTPRKIIPAGSVGIAGQQTGVYPLETPGGWQLIGRTPLKLFDATQQKPALLKAGDQVIFTSIDHHQFEQYPN